MEVADDQMQEPNTQASADNVATRPVISFSGTGGLNVAVWKNKAENDREHYSIRIERSFKDDSGNYKSTSYLREGDLLRAAKLIASADDWIEQDKAKTRSTAASRGR